MKLLIYKENLEYCKNCCTFIAMNEEKRRKFLKNEPREIEVEDFASGSTCVCYISKDDTSKKIIYKQFAPKSWLEKGKYIAIKDNSVYIKSETYDRNVNFVQTQYDYFLEQTSKNAGIICKQYNVEEANMFTKPELVLTNLGYMFSTEVTGEILTTTYNDLLASESKRKLLEELLEKTFRMFLTIKIAHKSGTLILDIKEENFTSVTLDNKKENPLVRLIDFGSCIGIDWLWNLLEDGNLDVNEFCDEYIYSNKKYYDIDEMKRILCNYNSEKDFSAKARNLDLTAVKKIFCNVLQCSTAGYTSIRDNNTPIENGKIKPILTEFFGKNTISSNPLEQYNIYSQLIEFFDADKVYDCLQILANVLSILKGQVYWEYEIRGSDADRVRVIREQEEAIILNERSKKLKFEKEKLSFFDIANKIDEGSLKKNIFGELYWFFLFGFWHSKEDKS